MLIIVSLTVINLHGRTSYRCGLNQQHQHHLLEVQVFRPYPRPTEIEILEVGPALCALSNPPRVYYMLKFEKHWLIDQKLKLWYQMAKVQIPVLPLSRYMTLDKLTSLSLSSPYVK